MDNKRTDPTIITIFGGSGDLAWRKLLPALYNLHLDGWLNDAFKIIGIGRQPIETTEFIKKLQDGVDQFSRSGKAKPEEWEVFAKKIEYVIGDFTTPSLYTSIKAHIADFTAACGDVPNINKIFYMAVAPSFFEVIANKLVEYELVTSGNDTRLVIEKPFGTDLESAKALNIALLKNFSESQLYRIDHYLGKETVQNILAFRFANALFEPIWNHHYIDHVQITVSEKLGLENRGGYYETSGLLRDMIQNHLLQLLCLIAMEPPVSFNADEVRNKKAEVLRAVRKYNHSDVHQYAVRGQYGDGTVDGAPAKGYREEKGQYTGVELRSC